MKILVTIQSIINYLKNHIIPMVWTDKIKFADGTEQTTAVSSGGSSTLYDIKTLAQTIADKGWCNISKKKVLPKTSNPTVYNDILNKYNNADIGNSTAMSQVTSVCYPSRNYVDIINDYAYTFRITDNYTALAIYKCAVTQLNDDNNWSLVVDIPKLHNGNTYQELINGYFGTNVIIVRIKYYDENNNVIYVYDYNGNLIKSFIVNEILDNDTYGLICKMNNYFYFTQRVTDKTYNIDLCKIEDLASNTISIETVANVPFDMKNIKYAFGKYWFGFNVDGYKNLLYCATDLTDYSTYQEKLNEGGTGDFCVFEDDIWQTIICNGAYGISKGSDDGGETFFDVGFTAKNFVSFTRQCFFQKETNSKCFCFLNGKDSSNNDMLAIVETPFTNRPNAIYNSISSISVDINSFTYVGFNDDYIIFRNAYDYCYFGVSQKVYTDTYNISGTSITISYYKNSLSQTKIVFGTSQNNDIDTVTEYLGYNPYFVLDTTTDSENVQLPINTNLWTYMFVGDDYIDTDFADGDYIPFALKPLKFTNLSANNWVSDNTYNDYSYKCELTCYGVTSDMFAQVIFAPTETDSGNYATVCQTGNGTVTIYSKVNDTITIPYIVVMGV